MSPRVLLSLIAAFLAVTSPSPVYVSVSGVTIHVPLLLIAATAVALACLAVTLLAVRILYVNLSRPGTRTAWSYP